MEQDLIKNKTKGPCVAALEDTLQSLNVQRQAYHSNCFIDNHVQKMRKVIYQIVAYVNIYIENMYNIILQMQC